MKRIISFSDRANGNCDQIASFIAGPQDQVVFFRDLHGQTMQDAILDVPEEKARIRGFVLG